MNGSEKMKLVKGVYRDIKAIELNDLLTKFIGKLEETCIGYEEELMNITLIEVERREKDFEELIKNPEDFHKVIDLIDKKNILEEILIELKDIVYVGDSSFNDTEVRYRTVGDIDWNLIAKPFIIGTSVNLVGKCAINGINNI